MMHYIKTKIKHTRWKLISLRIFVLCFYFFWFNAYAQWASANSHSERIDDTYLSGQNRYADETAPGFTYITKMRSLFTKDSFATTEDAMDCENISTDAPSPLELPINQYVYPLVFIMILTGYVTLNKIKGR